MLVHMKDLAGPQIYRTMVQTIVPRPVAWILSDNGDGSHNLAPFSYFSGVCSKPPIISISVGLKRDQSEKDTRLNIKERSHFVVHIPHIEQAGLVSETGAALDHGDSEVEKLGLELVDEPGFELPRLKDCRIAMFCKLEQIINVGEVPQALILGRIEATYFDDDYATLEGGEPVVDLAKVNPLIRLDAKHYAELGRLFEA